MNDQIITAIIAASVSLAISILGYCSIKSQLRHASNALEKETATKFVEVLLNHRLRLYPRAFSITEKVGKGDPDDQSTIENHKKALEELNQWKTGEVDCIISDQADELFDKLKERLKRNPGRGNFYSKEQLVKIYHDREMFRKALRKDLGTIHKSEKFITPVD